MHSPIRYWLFSHFHYTEFGEVPHFYLIETFDTKGIGFYEITSYTKCNLEITKGRATVTSKKQSNLSYVKGRLLFCFKYCIRLFNRNSYPMPFRYLHKIRILQLVAICCCLFFHKHSFLLRFDTRIWNWNGGK